MTLKRGVFPYAPEHGWKTASFDCGCDTLNDFLRQRLAVQQQRNVLRAYIVLTNEPEPAVAGYYTLSGASFERSLFGDRKRQIPYDSAPCVLLGRLAVDKTHAGKGIGSMLVADAARRVYDVARAVGVYAMFVEAKDGYAAQFYQQLGFLQAESTDGRQCLFFPIRALDALFTTTS
ncbi:GNAT family N-acetyltransferase [Cronobacter dublinensis]|uniref:GNAT family N-acetyltransferase n=1 Tax=Cronobacter dublinensis TaxID=413497 RepID=UPI000CFBA27C|nr:GNAT family N-acetyltransferase [Cronobacter dublinensis]EKY3225594.1 GNAT family N-acetyltransferase [Cronobacter dublinensis]MDT3607930.1 GNAT family N-acetyltransferase [Cronobacter dublinensis]